VLTGSSRQGAHDRFSANVIGRERNPAPSIYPSDALMARRNKGVKLMKSVFAVAAATLIGLSAPALAQNAGGAIGGAAAGAAIGGPVGAGVGAIVGSTLPSHPAARYSGQVVVGEALPEDVMVYPVPKYDDYSYTIVGKRRVIIDRHTRKIIRVIE
jgi:Protein of unknown function (DUF1236)